MQHERSLADLADLLATARAALRDLIVTGLSDDARYAALMVANAMAIAARQLAAGDRPLNEAHDRLTALYAAPDTPLAELARRLAADIRAGAFDAPTPRRAAALDHLWLDARAAAEHSNPKALSDRVRPT